VPWFTIVGVVKNVKQSGLDQNPGTELYLSLEQAPRVNQGAPFEVNLVLRTSQALGAVAPTILSAIRAMDPTLPIIQLRTMEQVFGGTVTRQ
jgi:hypothetical protein